MACLRPDYTAERPCHRGVRYGVDELRATWAGLFREVPDFRADLLAWAAAGDTAWAEWRWAGTHADGGTFEMQGVIILGIRDDRLAWGRLYIEPVVLARALTEEV
jgi:ketosteroid isomerase-like protein